MDGVDEHMSDASYDDRSFLEMLVGTSEGATEMVTFVVDYAGSPVPGDSSHASIADAPPEMRGFSLNGDCDVPKMPHAKRRSISRGGSSHSLPALEIRKTDIAEAPRAYSLSSDPKRGHRQRGQEGHSHQDFADDREIDDIVGDHVSLKRGYFSHCGEHEPHSSLKGKLASTDIPDMGMSQVSWRAQMTGRKTAFSGNSCGSDGDCIPSLHAVEHANYIGGGSPTDAYAQARFLSWPDVPPGGYNDNRDSPTTRTSHIEPFTLHALSHGRTMTILGDDYIVWLCGTTPLAPDDIAPDFPVWRNACISSMRGVSE